MKTVAGDRKHQLAAESISGAGDGDIGVAGSVPINSIDTITRAVIPDSAVVTLGGNELTVDAQSDVEAIAKGVPVDGGGGMGTDVGVGGSVVVNRVNNVVTAEIENDAVIGGTISNLSVTATGEFITTTEASNGAGGDVAVGAAVAISLPDNDVTARIGTGAAISLSGDLDVIATDTHTATATAEGDAAGDNVGVGASIAVGVVEDDAVANSFHATLSSGAPSTWAR